MGGIELTGKHERTFADWHRTCAGSQLAGKHASPTKSKQTGQHIWRAYKQKQTLHTHKKSGEQTAGWTACRHMVRVAEAERRRALAQAARREAVTRGSSPGAHSGSVGSTDRYTCAQSARALSAFSATPGPRARNSACAIMGPNVWQFLITHVPSQAPGLVRDARCMRQPRLDFSDLKLLTTHAWQSTALVDLAIPPWEEKGTTLCGRRRDRVLLMQVRADYCCVQGHC